MCDLKYVIPPKYVFAPHCHHWGRCTWSIRFRDKTISPAHSEMCSALLASYYLTIRVLHLGRDLLDSESALHSFHSLPSFDFCAADTRNVSFLWSILKEMCLLASLLVLLLFSSDLKPSNFHIVKEVHGENVLSWPDATWKRYIYIQTFKITSKFE